MTTINLNSRNSRVEVLQADRFTRAAQSMGTQKAGVFRVAAQPEKRLGVRLASRLGRIRQAQNPITR